MTEPSPAPRRRRAKSAPAGRAIGWWVAGFEERIYPERETVEERVRWGTETRAASGEGADLVVRFPDDPAAPGHRDRADAGPDAAPPPRPDDAPDLDGGPSRPDAGGNSPEGAAGA